MNGSFPLDSPILSQIGFTEEEVFFLSFGKLISSLGEFFSRIVSLLLFNIKFKTIQSTIDLKKNQRLAKKFLIRVFSLSLSLVNYKKVISHLEPGSCPPYLVENEHISGFEFEFDENIKMSSEHFP